MSHIYNKGLLLQFQHIKSYHTCIYNRLPEDEPSSSKHVEDIEKLNTQILIYEISISLGRIV
jgi:hypothetical protein